MTDGGGRALGNFRDDTSGGVASTGDSAERSRLARLLDFNAAGGVSGIEDAEHARVGRSAGLPSIEDALNGSEDALFTISLRGIATRVNLRDLVTREVGGGEDKAVVSNARIFIAVNDLLAQVTVGLADRGVTVVTHALGGSASKIETLRVGLNAETITATGSGLSDALSVSGVADSYLAALVSAVLGTVLADTISGSAATTGVIVGEDVGSRGLEGTAAVFDTIHHFERRAHLPDFDASKITRSGVRVAVGFIAKVVISGLGAVRHGTTAVTITGLATTLREAAGLFADTSGGGVSAHAGRGREGVAIRVGGVASPGDALVVGVERGVEVSSVLQVSDSALTIAGVAAIDLAGIGTRSADALNTNPSTTDLRVTYPGVAGINTITGGGVLLLGDALTVGGVADVVVAVREGTSAGDWAISAVLFEAEVLDTLIGGVGVRAGARLSVAADLTIRDEIDGAVDAIVAEHGLLAVTASTETAARGTARLVVGIASTRDNFERVVSELLEGVTFDNAGIFTIGNDAKFIVRDSGTDTDGV